MWGGLGGDSGRVTWGQLRTGNLARAPWPGLDPNQNRSKATSLDPGLYGQFACRNIDEVNPRTSLAMHRSDGSNSPPRGGLGYKMLDVHALGQRNRMCDIEISVSLLLPLRESTQEDHSGLENRSIIIPTSRNVSLTVLFNGYA